MSDTENATTSETALPGTWPEMREFLQKNLPAGYAIQRIPHYPFEGNDVGYYVSINGRTTLQPTFTLNHGRHRYHGRNGEGAQYHDFTTFKQMMELIIGRKQQIEELYE